MARGLDAALQDFFGDLRYSSCSKDLGFQGCSSRLGSGVSLALQGFTVLLMGLYEYLYTVF